MLLNGKATIKLLLNGSNCFKSKLNNYYLAQEIIFKLQFNEAMVSLGGFY